MFVNTVAYTVPGKVGEKVFSYIFYNIRPRDTYWICSLHVTVKLLKFCRSTHRCCPTIRLLSPTATVCCRPLSRPAIVNSATGVHSTSTRSSPTCSALSWCTPPDNVQSATSSTKSFQLTHTSPKCHRRATTTCGGTLSRWSRSVPQSTLEPPKRSRTVYDQNGRGPQGPRTKTAAD